MNRPTNKTPCMVCDKEVSREVIISALKKRFPVNNPSSWNRHSTKKLKGWYEEYIVKNK